MSESNHVQVNSVSVFTSRRSGPKELIQHGKQIKQRFTEKSSIVSSRRTDSRGREQAISPQSSSASTKLSLSSQSIEVSVDSTSGTDHLMSSSPAPVSSMSATQATATASTFAAPNSISITNAPNNSFPSNSGSVSSIVGRPYKANAKALKNKGRAKKKIVINSSGGGGGGGVLHDDDELDELDLRSYNSNSRSAARSTRPSKRPNAQRSKSAYHPAPRKKEAFLQANYHFTITPGEYQESLSNPDKPVSWDAVECVHLPVTDNPPHCPICLDRPVAPKITKCGHIFCYACILHYLSIGPRSWKRCPLCFESVYPKALKSLSFDYHPKYKPGDVVDFVLLKRFKDSIVPFKHGDAPESDNNKFSRLTVTTDISSILNSERRELNEALAKQQQLAKEQEEALKKHMAKPPPAPSSFFGTAAAPVFVPPAAQTAPVHTPSPPAVNPGPVRRTLSDIVKEANGIGPASSPPASAGTSASTSGGYVAGTHHTAQFEDLSDTMTYIKAALDAIDQREKEWKAEQVALAAGPSASQTVAPKTANSAPILDAFYESDDEPAPLVRSESTESVGSRKGKKKAQAADSGDSSPTKSANKLSATARAFVPAAAATPQPPLARTASHNEEKDGDFHYFYQAADGQQVYLHAVNYQCLITEYGGSPSTLPPVLSAQLMDVDSYVMDEDNRRKFRFLSHLPLTSSFHIFFVDLSPILSTATINQFSDKLAQRLKRREAMAKEQERLSRLAREAVERESLARSKSHPTYRLSENSDYASDDYDSMHGTPYRYAAPAPPDANESSHFPELKSDSGNKVSLSPPGSPTHTNAAPRVTGWSTLAQKGFASSTMWAALPAKSTPSQGPSQPGSQGLSLSPKLQSSQSSLSPEKTPSHGELPQHAAHEPFSLSSSVPISSGPPASSHSAWGSVSSAQSPQTIIGNLVASTYGVSPHVSASYVPPPAPAAAGGGDKSKKGGKKKKEVLFGVSSHHHYK